MPDFTNFIADFSTFNTTSQPTYDPSLNQPPIPAFQPPTPTVDPGTAFPPPTYDPGNTFPQPTPDPGNAFPQTTFDAGAAFPPPTYDPGAALPPPTFDFNAGSTPPSFDLGNAFAPPSFDLPGPSFDPGASIPSPTFDFGSPPPPSFDLDAPIPPPAFDNGLAPLSFDGTSPFTTYDPGIPPPPTFDSTPIDTGAGSPFPASPTTDTFDSFVQGPPTFDFPLPGSDPSSLPPFNAGDLSTAATFDLSNLGAYDPSLGPPDAILTSAPTGTDTTSNAATPTDVSAPANAIPGPSSTPGDNTITYLGAGSSVSSDGTSYYYSQQTISGDPGQQVITQYENRADGSVVVHQQYESENYEKDHTVLWPAPPVPEAPTPQTTAQNPPPPPPPTTTAEDVKQSPFVQGVGGFVTGAGLGQIPLVGPLIGPAAAAGGIVGHPTKDFQTGYGLGSIAAGVYQTVTGGAAIAGGGSEAVGGAVGAPVSGGVSAIASVAGVAEATAGYIVAAQGVANIQAGVLVLANAGMTSPGGPRSSPQATEKFAASGTSSVRVETQKSYIGGGNARYAQPGSTRPDLTFPDHGLVVEIKNYDLSKGNGKLVDNVVKQAINRAKELPPGTKQALVIDVRGQSIPYTQLEKLFVDVNAKTGNLFDSRWWVFMN